MKRFEITNLRTGLQFSFDAQDLPEIQPEWGTVENKKRLSDCDAWEASVAQPAGQDEDGNALVQVPAGYSVVETELSGKLDPLWVKLRSKRDALLSACDFTQLADAPFTPEQKQAWVTYRQALRDLTKNTLDPANPTWPLAPS